MASHMRDISDGTRVTRPVYRVATALVCLVVGTLPGTAQTIEDEDLRLQGIVGDETPPLPRDDEAPLVQPANIRSGTAQQAVPPVQTAGSVNPRQTTVDSQANRVFDDDPFGPVGLRIGRFILRPSVTQQIAHDIDQDGDSRTERTYSRTVLRGELVSDWSRHQLRLNGEQVIDRTISGDGPQDPGTLVEADLRLDLSESTTANLGFDYEFGRESQSDANAIGDAFAQSNVHEFDANASIEHVFGSWRGRASIDIGRATYGDAELSDGTIVQQSDRNETDYTMTLRAGMDIGARHLPFIEGGFGQIIYDDPVDVSGYARSSRTYGFRVGTAFNSGEKLNGEIAIGYAQRNIDDPRLSPISGVTIDGYANWSPRRGTNTFLALSTTLEDSTTPGESGSIYYLATTEITHELRENVDVTVSALVGWRDYMDILSNQFVYGAGAGFTWWLNRRFGFEGGVSYEKTVTRNGGSDRDDFFAGIGITLRP